MSAWLGLTAPCAVIMLVTGALLYFMPRLTRPDLYFAVTVPADFPDSAEGGMILRRYRTTLLVVSLIALVLLFGVADRESLGWSLAALIVQDAGCVVAYVQARAQVKPRAVAPTTAPDAQISHRPAHIPGGWPLLAGPHVVLGAVAIYLNRRWADIPERFPIHWGMDGRPNGWSAHTVAGVYGPLLVAAAICAALTALAYGVLHGSRPIRTSGPEGEAEAGFRGAVAGVLVAAQYLLAALFGWAAVLPLRGVDSGPPVVWGILVPTLAFAVVTTVILIRKGQGGTRAWRPSPEISAGAAQPPVGDRTEDRYWKAGILYVNPQDPALFVEKRFGIGYTLNFGRPGSWLILAAFVVVPLALALLVHLGSAN